MKILEAGLDGIKIFEPDVFGDSRGFFMETWQEQRYTAAGAIGHFVQDNVAFSKRGVLRGLHYQFPNPQAKLVYALYGEVFDVAVDIRKGSPTFGKWASVILSAENRRQVYIPPGFAHGYYVLSKRALVAYKCDDYYSSRAEHSIFWNDGDIGVQWPSQNPVVSEKDAKAPRLAQLDKSHLPE
ncbi:MAG: dTDP-4-dehydrorhamnose 3,5-epimerase [Nitrospinae bacterium]|nr:dTDP-4-dehydrorhamnose 3,5-epimerase [Nitrospinota bacterium]